jgi:hypothetical protein
MDGTTQVETIDSLSRPLHPILIDKAMANHQILVGYNEQKLKNLRSKASGPVIERSDSRSAEETACLDSPAMPRSIQDDRQSAPNTHPNLQSMNSPLEPASLDTSGLASVSQEIRGEQDSSKPTMSTSCKELPAPDSNGKRRWVDLVLEANCSAIHSNATSNESLFRHTRNPALPLKCVQHSSISLARHLPTDATKFSASHHHGSGSIQSNNCLGSSKIYLPQPFCKSAMGKANPATNCTPFTKSQDSPQYEAQASEKIPLTDEDSKVKDAIELNDIRAEISEFLSQMTKLGKLMFIPLPKFKNLTSEIIWTELTNGLKSLMTDINQSPTDTIRQMEMIAEKIESKILKAHKKTKKTIRDEKVEKTEKGEAKEGGWGSSNMGDGNMSRPFQNTHDDFQGRDKVSDFASSTKILSTQPTQPWPSSGPNHSNVVAREGWTGESYSCECSLCVPLSSSAWGNELHSTGNDNQNPKPAPQVWNYCHSWGSKSSSPSTNIEQHMDDCTRDDLSSVGYTRDKGWKCRYCNMAWDCDGVLVQIPICTFDQVQESPSVWSNRNNGDAQETAARRWGDLGPRQNCTCQPLDTALCQTCQSSQESNCGWGEATSSQQKPEVPPFQEPYCCDCTWGCAPECYESSGLSCSQNEEIWGLSRQQQSTPSESSAHEQKKCRCGWGDVTPVHINHLNTKQVNDAWGAQENADEDDSGEGGEGVMTPRESEFGEEWEYPS